jgi:hypothetical protein
MTLKRTAAATLLAAILGVPAALGLATLHQPAAPASPSVVTVADGDGGGATTDGDTNWG